MPPSLETSISTLGPSLTSETSSIASSELPRTASENFNHSPSPWRAPSVTTDQAKDHSQQSLPPRLTKRLFRLVGTSHHQSLSAPTNTVELNAYTQRQHQAELEEEAERTQAPRKSRTREEAAASWGRTSLASAASTTPLASKHSSLGPLPIFPRPPVHIPSHHPARTRHIQPDQEQSLTLSEQGSDAVSTEDDHYHHHHHHHRRLDAPLPPTPTLPPPPRTITPSSTRKKSRPTLASLFQAAGRKALRRDEYRKDSFRADSDAGHYQEEQGVSQSVPSTPLRRRFLGLMSAAGDTIRSAKSTPHPPLPPPLPIISMPTTFRKENSASTPPTPILKRKRSSLPLPPRQQQHPHEYESAPPPPMPIPAPSQRQQQQQSQPSGDYLDPNHSQNHYTLRRSRSDSKHAGMAGKRSHSPGHTLTTSIRVPGPPQQHHPHPHPFFPCDGPLDRGMLLNLPSFDFERPATRPSTPGQSQEFLPMDHHHYHHHLLHHRDRRNRARVADDATSEMSAEIKSVLAAGTEARRERRAPSRERLRVIGPMQRQNIPDVTGGDDELSPDPGGDQRFSSQPVHIPSSSRSKTQQQQQQTHVAHGLFAFESPAATPYGSRVDLPPTPPPSKPRRMTPTPPPRPHTQQGHHRHFSSSATAVGPGPPPPQPPPKDRDQDMDREMGLLKGFASPRLFAGNKPAQAQHDRNMMGSVSSPYDKHHNRGQSLQHSMKQRQDSMDSSREGGGIKLPSSYRQHAQNLHGHSHSLSGSTTVQNHYYPTPVQSPVVSPAVGLGMMLYPPTKPDRYDDLREAMRLSIGDSRFRSFERAVRRYNDRAIPMYGRGGLFERVQRLLNEAVDDGLPSQTARKYFQTFQAIHVDAC